MNQTLLKNDLFSSHIFHSPGDDTPGLRIGEWLGGRLTPAGIEKRQRSFFDTLPFFSLIMKNVSHTFQIGQT